MCILERYVACTHIRKHIVLVNLLMCKEIKWNGLHPHAIPFYSKIANASILMRNNKINDNKKQREITE